LAAVKTFAFDKTGTLTTGRAEVTGVVSLMGDEVGFLRLLAGIEAQSEHSIAGALRREVAKRGHHPILVTDVQTSPSEGITGRDDQGPLWAGNPRMVERKGAALDHVLLADLQANPQTVVYLGREAQVLGAISVADQPRATAQQGIAALRASGVTQTVMMTGDRRAVALRIADQLGITPEEVHADLLPQDKVAAVDQLEKRGVFSADQADVERRHAWRQLLERRSGDAGGLKDLWKRLPERYRRQTSVAAAAAAGFNVLGLGDEAVAIIESSLDADWDGGLVTLYGECGSANALRQIERGERWLREHRKDGALLLALGRLCARQQLWGKAQSYFEASVAVEPTYSAHLELAQLHDRLERVDDARKHYRASLELAVAQLKRASGGRRRQLL
jgi:hypothetical protein